MKVEGFTELLIGIKIADIDSRAAESISLMSVNWLGEIAEKYANITKRPPTYTRNRRIANHLEAWMNTRVEVINAIKISQTPKVSGLSTKKIERVSEIKAVITEYKIICKPSENLVFRSQVPTYLYTILQRSSPVNREK